MLRRLLACLAVLCLASNSHGQHQVGDVVVANDNIQIRANDGTTQTVAAGTLLPVQGIAADQLWVAHELAGLVDSADILSCGEAIDFFSDQVKQDSDNAIWYIARGNARRCLDRCAGAFEDYSKAIELDPENARAYQNRGYTLARGIATSELRKYGPALADLSAAVKLQPDNAMSFYRRGIVRQQAGQLEQARDDFDKALELRPDFGYALVARGILHCDAEQYESALAAFNSALEANPSHWPVYLARGNCFSRQKEYQQTIEDFEAALQVYPKAAPVLDQLARVRLGCPDENLRDAEAALEHAKTAVKLTDWNIPQYIHTLSKAFHAGGNHSKGAEVRLFGIRVAIARDHERSRRLIDSHFDHCRCKENAADESVAQPESAPGNSAPADGDTSEPPELDL